MQQIHTENWVIIYFVLILMITCAQIVVVYVLSDASNPTPGLGLFAVYFMASLLAWIAFALQQWSDIDMPVDIPSVASLFNSFILFLAAGQRAGIKRGRYVMGVYCFLTCVSVFFVPPRDIFVLQAGSAAFFYSAIGVLCLWRCWQRDNAGDGILACAALLMLVGMSVALQQWLTQGDSAQARTIAFGVNTSVYLLVSVGFLASVLVEYQHNLSHLALEDPLTQLHNRRGLENALHIPLTQAARGQLPTAAVMVGIDHCKEMNSNFGSDKGDQVIRLVARHLQRLSRASDVVARIGGDEFLLVLPQTDLDGARILAERIRSEICERPLVVSQQRIPVTVSIGVAGTYGDVDLDKLAQDADRAMQLAKRGGRNRVASVDNKPIHLSAQVSRA
jgi:diguanylate cyclase (GGDEF)-like protein